MRRQVNILILALMALMLTPGCKRIPLYDATSGVYIKTDIKLAIDVELSADFDISGHPDLEAKIHGKMPEMIRACFYDRGSHNLVYEEYLPAEGGFVGIGPGEYDLIVYSMGTQETMVTGTETRGAGYAYTAKTGTKVKVVSKSGSDTGMSDAANVIYEPDHIFVGRVADVVIPVRPAGSDPIIIEVKMPTLLETYTLEIVNVVGAGNIQKADIYVTGQAPSKYLWDEHWTPIPSALYFRSLIDPTKGHLFSVFNTFGKLPNTEASVFLNILVTTGGGKYQWIFDVTDQFDNPDNTGHEIIIDDDIVVPDGSDVGGFRPAVDDWDAEIVYVPLS